MAKLIGVDVVEHWKLKLTYDDGLEGEMNFKYLEKKEEFSKLKDPAYFSTVSINEFTNDVYWDQGASLCKNAIYKSLDLIRMMKGFHIDIDKI